MKGADRSRRLAVADGRVRRLAFFASALAALGLPLSACPSCSVGQAIETLALVMSFMLIPYLVVSGVWFWIRAILARDDGSQPPR